MLAIINQVNIGHMRLLAATSHKRTAARPNVPTLIEAGVPGYEAMSWYMLLAPAKTPMAVVDKINRETAGALKQKDMLDMLARGGTEPMGNITRQAADYRKT